MEARYNMEFIIYSGKWEGRERKKIKFCENLVDKVLKKFPSFFICDEDLCVEVGYDPGDIIIRFSYNSPIRGGQSLLTPSEIIRKIRELKPPMVHVIESLSDEDYELA